MSPASRGGEQEFDGHFVLCSILHIIDSIHSTAAAQWRVFMTKPWKYRLMMLALAIAMVPAAHAAWDQPAADGIAVITAVGSDGVVTARDAKERPFSFKVTDPKLLHSLQLGQSVLVNQKAGRVSIAGADQCCELMLQKPALAPPRPVVVQPKS
jgi:hypothetical protein